MTLKQKKGSRIPREWLHGVKSLRTVTVAPSSEEPTTETTVHCYRAVGRFYHEKETLHAFALIRGSPRPGSAFVHRRL